MMNSSRGTLEFIKKSLSAFMGGEWAASIANLPDHEFLRVVLLAIVLEDGDYLHDLIRSHDRIRIIRQVDIESSIEFDPSVTTSRQIPSSPAGIERNRNPHYASAAAQPDNSAEPSVFHQRLHMTLPDPALPDSIRGRS